MRAACGKEKGWLFENLVVDDGGWHQGLIGCRSQHLYAALEIMGSVEKGHEGS